MKKVIGTTAMFAALFVSHANASPYTQARQAVCYYFKGHCSEAMRVASCETGGTYNPYATNGQYLGIFQMGRKERGRFGHGNSVWAQAKAAYAYFSYSLRVNGYGWTPWSCKP